VPVRVPAATREAEQRQLVSQRDAARAFDARLREIDPVLDPAARPPEPPDLAGQPRTGQAPVPVPVPVATAAPPAIRPEAPRVVPATPPAAVVDVPAYVPPPTMPAPPPPVRAAAPVVRPAPPPAVPVAQGVGARNAWIIGDIDFADGSALLSREARGTLREAVVAAQERGGRVRITPSAGRTLSPPEQALSPRRAAAAAGELEALGLERARILMDPGALRSARVAVEF
jgi:outer membrane protein OmpA-like peptidoglycan-associated protein